MTEEKNIDVSIVIVNWNTKLLLKKCIDSIMKYTANLRYEIIVVDNGSEDGSPAMLKSSYPSVRLIENGANLGFSKANNIGLRHSRGAYLCLVNSDVELLSNVLESLINYVRENPHVGLIAPAILNQDRTLQESSRKYPSVWFAVCEALVLHKIFKNKELCSWENSRCLSSETPSPVDVLYGCFLLMKRECLEQTGLLDEDFYFYGEDVEWSRRFRENGYTNVYYPREKVVHYGGGSTKVRPITYEIQRQNAKFLYWEKHSSLPKYYLVKAITAFQHMNRMVVALFMKNLSGNPEKYDYMYDKSKALIKAMLAG